MLYLFEGYALDTDRRELRRGSDLIAIEPQAFDILEYLVRNCDRVVSRDDLIASVWGGRIVSESALSTRLNAVRTAIGDSGAAQRLIKTLPRKGVRFVGAVREDRKSTGRSSIAVSPSEGSQAQFGAPQPVGTIPAERRHPPRLDKPSIAVLPFANLSADDKQDYFVDGMVEEIILALSRIRWLMVMARNSSFIYKGQAIDVKRVGRELGVHYVLEGSVRRVGGQVRITAQLIDAESGAHLWADRFGGSMEDVFRIQDTVASNVAGAIEPTLQAIEILRSREWPTDDLPAYDLFLRAREYFHSHDRDGFIQALDLLRQAIARDECYGDALSLAAQCHATLHVGGWADDAEANRRQGVDLAHRALRVAGDDAVVLARAAESLGNLEEDIDAAIALIERSLAVNSNLARVWSASGWLRLWAGQTELGIEHLMTAQRLNPLERRIELAIGVGHFFARRFDQARVLLLRSLQAYPGWVANYRFLAACYAHMGRLDEAREMVQRLRALTPLVVPTAEHWRDPQQRELYLSGLRLAAGVVEVTDSSTGMSPSSASGATSGRRRTSARKRSTSA